MKNILQHTIFICFLSVVTIISAQNAAISTKNTYADLRNHYENMEENDERALYFANIYLEKAKKENNSNRIVQGYRDLIFYSKKREIKLQYADSCISYALKSKNNELISKSYLGKGIIYYFFYKRYQPALDEYLKAYKYSANIQDKYLKNSITYHLAVVKSYLGYYEDALKLFSECIAYFEPLTRSNIHPNLIFNNQKGYFNSLHQQIICYQQMNNSAQSDSLIHRGLSALPQSKEFELEKSYFLKSKGISDYNKGDYKNAISNFNNALPEFKKINDFTWMSVSYFYIGKSYQKIHNDDLAIPYFVKVDSIFQTQTFILPEVRKNYEILINHYHKIKNPKEELYYTKQLLKADSTLNKDFKYLSSKIYKEYDAKTLLEMQKYLENKNFIRSTLLIVAAILIMSLLIILIYHRRKEKKIQQNYKELEKWIIKQEDLLLNTPVSSNIIQENKSEILNTIIEDILKKLEKFEKRKGFRKKGLTQSELAKKFETNTSYLSQIINVYKHKNFNAYLNELRINYITQELYHNPKYLDYTIEGLSEDCGFSSRQNFSELFKEINGIRAADFIRKRIAELKQNENIVTT